MTLKEAAENVTRAAREHEKKRREESPPPYVESSYRYWALVWKNYKGCGGIYDLTYVSNDLDKLKSKIEAEYDLRSPECDDSRWYADILDVVEGSYYYSAWEEDEAELSWVRAYVSILGVKVV